MKINLIFYISYLAGLSIRLRQAATAQRQNVVAKNRAVRPAKIPTIIGVQRAGEFVDFIGFGV
jgi:hypothetical protein